MESARVVPGENKKIRNVPGPSTAGRLRLLGLGLGAVHGTLLINQSSNLNPGTLGVWRRPRGYCVFWNLQPGSQTNMAENRFTM